MLREKHQIVAGRKMISSRLSKNQTRYLICQLVILHHQVYMRSSTMMCVRHPGQLIFYLP